MYHSRVNSRVRGRVEVERVIYFCTGMVLNTLRVEVVKWTTIQ